MMGEVNEKVIQAAFAAQRIQGNDETQIWHVLRSVVEFCDHNRINFDRLLKEVKEDFNP